MQAERHSPVQVQNLLRMAQRVDKRLTTRLGENAFADVRKGQAIIQGHRTTRTRSALGQLGQHVNKAEIPTGKRINSQECMPCKDLAEEGAKKATRTPSSMLC